VRQAKLDVTSWLKSGLPKGESKGNTEIPSQKGNRLAEAGRME